MIISGPIRGIGSLNNNAVELLADMADRFLNFAQVRRAGGQIGRQWLLYMTPEELFESFPAQTERQIKEARSVR